MWFNVRSAALDSALIIKTRMVGTKDCIMLNTSDGLSRY